MYIPFDEVVGSCGGWGVCGGPGAVCVDIASSGHPVFVCGIAGAAKGGAVGGIGATGDALIVVRVGVGARACLYSHAAAAVKVEG